MMRAMSAASPVSPLKLAATALQLAAWPALLFVVAGDARWLEGWLFTAWFFALCSTVIVWLYRKDPALLAERYRRPGTGGQKGSDLVGRGGQARQVDRHAARQRRRLGRRGKLQSASLKFGENKTIDIVADLLLAGNNGWLRSLGRNEGPVVGAGLGRLFGRWQAGRSGRDPLLDERSFLARQWRLGWHLVRVDPLPQQAVVRHSGRDGRTGFAASRDAARRAQIQATLVLHRAVALDAAGTQQWQNVVTQVRRTGGIVGPANRCAANGGSCDEGRDESCKAMNGLTLP